MTRILLLLSMSLLAGLVWHGAHAAETTIVCTTPVKNTDDSELTNLAGFNLYGANTDKLRQTSTVCRFTEANLTQGDHVWYVKAFNSAGIESDPTSVVHFMVEATPPPTCGASPAPESRQQTCTAPSVGQWTQQNVWASAPAPTCWVADWQPTSAPAGVCAAPAPLTTAGPLSYQDQGTTTVPKMAAIGLVAAGLPCGPAVRLVGTVKYCQITRAQTDLIVWPTVLSLPAIWARAQ